MSFKICFDYFVTVVPPGGYFTFMKMLPNVSFIIKVIRNIGFFTTNSHIFIVFQRKPRSESIILKGSEANKSSVLLTFINLQVNADRM